VAKVQYFLLNLSYDIWYLKPMNGGYRMKEYMFLSYLPKYYYIFEEIKESAI